MGPPCNWPGGEGVRGVGGVGGLFEVGAYSNEYGTTDPFLNTCSSVS